MKGRLKKDMERVCEGCGITFSAFASRQRYCGSYKAGTGCSWKSARSRGLKIKNPEAVEFEKLYGRPPGESDLKQFFRFWKYGRRVWVEWSRKDKKHD